MLQARIHGPGDVRVDDVPEPVLGPRDVVVRVAACGICGSDLSYIRMGGVAGPGPEPMCLGHEVAGTVEAAGDSVTSVRVGDRVVVRPGTDALGRIGNGAPEGGLAPLLLVTEADRRGVYRIPDALPLEDAALAEPLAVGMHAVEQAEATAEDGVAVFGCGPIGLAAIATLVDAGNERVVAIDPSPTRRALANGLGALAAVDPTTDDVWSALADLHGTTPFMFGPTPATAAYIEASGVAGVLSSILERGAPGGRLAVVALHYAPIKTSFLTLLMKQFTVRGSMEYPARFEDAVDLLARRDLSALTTHRFPLADLSEALALLDGSKDCGKVSVLPG
jgi:2-desacetyl-2-hydroxyethyl bacteriochlorophyllide A dehydrogenase